MTPLREIVRTCSNAHVARAALASIGGEFAVQFAADATRRNLSSGALAARLVREFAESVDEVGWEEVAQVTRGADQPILMGLRHILDRSLRVEARAAKGLPRETPPAWAICASRGHICGD
ncbi:MAG: hypothetical protein ABSC22_16775 [Roseiarcus sp.]